MNRTGITELLLAFAVLSVATSSASVTTADENEWVKYSERKNGDSYFFDPTRVETFEDSRRVWNGIRYKTSLMGAFSFQSLVEIDCSNRIEKTLQSTFFSDKNWKDPAMQTDTSESAERPIEAGSAMEHLANIVCDQ